ncbi:hypothetical protein SAMN05216356_105117 [Oribacterium sp. WCC10]|nr:hypothetical protein SAMN05216356_105117 [Oribacterium sp. WCC10]
MLALFKESAVKIMNETEGAIVPFHRFYDALENFLDHSHRSVIIRAFDNSKINPEKKTDDVFTINVLKTLFMIKYILEIEANVENITSLMIDNIDNDRIELKDRVEESLKILQQQMLVQKNGSLYVFLTDEEQEINREIESQNVEMAEVINKVSEMIFEDIFSDKRYRYPAFSGRYAFSFNQTVDDRPYKSNQNYDIGLRILTPWYDGGNDDATLRMMSGTSREVVVLLPNDSAFLEELMTYLKIEKFLRLNTSSQLTKYETIKEAKRVEMRERNSNAKLYLTESLKAATIYVNGDVANLSSKEVTQRINEAIGKLVQTVYHKLSYIDTAFDEASIRKMFSDTNQIKLELGNTGEANAHALDDVLSFISGNAQIHIKTSMKTIKDRFMSAPYGFVEDDVHWLIARLFKRSDISLTVNGTVVNLLNKTPDEIVNYIIRKQYVDSLLMGVRGHVYEKYKKVVQTVAKELFGSAFVTEDEDSVMRTFQKYSENRLNEMNALAINYNQYAFPGKKVIDSGKKLMQDLVQYTDPKEFFEYISNNQDDLLDYAEDYDPVKSFFSGEQQKIFARALDMLDIYEDSKTYIVDKNLENIVSEMQRIVKLESPYREIPKLPDLRDKFMNAYTTVLENAAIPVKKSIEDDKDRVIEVIDTKEYKDEKKAGYLHLFSEIWDGADTCNNVSRLRAYADKASALKIRLLDEMNDLDAELAAKNAREEQLKKQKPDEPNTDLVIEVPKKKKTKNVTIKNVAHTSSWRIEKAEDVDRYIEELRKSLLGELNQNDIVNVEF